MENSNYQKLARQTRPNIYRDPHAGRTRIMQYNGWLI